MGNYTLNLERYAQLARKAAAEGCVLLKNDNHTLPLRNNDRVAVFGRIAFHYYKSGLGSGGLVNTRYAIGILDALKKEEQITLNQDLLHQYEDWITANPFDEGEGWGKVPWSQAEMEISEEAVQKAATESDIALVIVGRTAGEDQDNKNEPGSYLLTDVEEALIEKVSRSFARTAVILNVGNIIDMKWVGKYQPQAVLYAWQGGQEGGNGVVDVLTGKVNPCGKLTDTIAEDIRDYPSTEYFGSLTRNYYHEDIYVGYRYFETFAKDRVLYPFGFGLSFTTFKIESEMEAVSADRITLSASVTNTGSCAGKETVQVYLSCPQGVLGKPSRVLAGFAKTGLLEPGCSEQIRISIPKYLFASYDDSGKTGHKSCYVLEAGTYQVYTGSDVRSAVLTGSYEEAFTVLQELEEAYAPTEQFTRLKAEIKENGELATATEPVPLRTSNPYEKMKAQRNPEIPYRGDRGIRLSDVLDKKALMDDFVSQLGDEDLISMFRGEGMCSPKVTPGTAAAFGGVTENLRSFGIPVGCCADGPSGIRMDCGTKAFSLPNGTLLGCTFDLDLVQELYRMLGLELRKNRIDTLLGPGMNIHRNPLNGRNFEYISEDPLLTGRMGAAQLLGMNHSQTTGTIKHFCGNNQEMKRREADSVISERALREIYLRGFELAVKEGNCRSVMTTYGPVNGIWTAGSYDLNTVILRKEWGFEGIVMTDWWAPANGENLPSDMKQHGCMAAAQNDLYMVTTDSTDMEQDDLLESLANGSLTRSDLQRNAKNILGFLLQSPAMLHEMNRISQEELDEMKAADEDGFSPEQLDYYVADTVTDEIRLDGSGINTRKGNAHVFGITIHKFGIYEIEMKLKSDLDDLAQLPVTVYYDNTLKAMISVQGSNGAWVVEQRELGFIFGANHYVKLYFGADGLELDDITIRLKEEISIVI